MIPNPAQAHASISTTGTASTLATLGFALHANTETILIQAVGGDVRFTLNGTNPTASLGILLTDGDFIQLSRGEAEVMKAITGASAPKLEIVSYVLS